jgi:hypothetical protein
VIWNSGPFYGVFRNHHWLYRLGFRWYEDMLPVRSGQGWCEFRTHKRRFQWRFVPLTRWRPPPPLR